MPTRQYLQLIGTISVVIANSLFPYGTCPYLYPRGFSLPKYNMLPILVFENNNHLLFNDILLNDVLLLDNDIRDVRFPLLPQLP